MPDLYVIAGCNGAGKTTASFLLLPSMLNCHIFLNADEIARGISPFNPEKSAIEAGKILLKHFDDNLRNKLNFAVETTLADKSYITHFQRAREFNYRVVLIFLWLPTTKIARERVKDRVRRGGHDIPGKVITRRYYAGITNFFQNFKTIVDSWYFIDNSKSFPELIAQSENGKEKIFDLKKWNVIKEKYEKKYKD